MVQSPPLRPRILLIEDDPGRIDVFRKWLATTAFVLIEASSAGRALGILRKGRTDGIAGICLDHDLERQPVTFDDHSLSGSDVLNAIVASMPRDVPVLIHSMNVEKPLQMERRLSGAGFQVTRIRMSALTDLRFHAWLEEVQDAWDWSQCR